MQRKYLIITQRNCQDCNGTKGEEIKKNWKDKVEKYNPKNNDYKKKKEQF